MLLLSCAPPPTVTSKPTSPCVIPAIPPTPALDPKACGNAVCLTVQEAVAVARWVHAVVETRVALAGCSLVQVK